MVAILVLKTHLILYQPRRGDWYEADKLQVEMSYSLLTRLPDHPRWDLTQVRNIVHSPWPAHLPILPLNTDPLQFNYNLGNKYPDNLTMIPVDYAECHQAMGLHCIWILSGMSYTQDDMMFYAKFRWINHILDAVPSDETLQVVLDNVAFLNQEDARRALEWAEGAEPQDLAQQLIRRIRRHLKPLPVDVNQSSGNKVKHRWMEKFHLKKLYYT
ncbi:hypothetical protein BT96DRAFT_860722 [Gymnopus androsaceus JB14]|uniref:Uncharacterized protein n=1 Tax=Gymnopus androsaceus JB14 TaxID=1447944 RepID=A0A6A4HEE5_9AGAR|nr:hypothetical protein BT96DRAFT_860722 [Gymnopus androsaceus JB14]